MRFPLPLSPAVGVLAALATASPAPAQAVLDPAGTPPPVLRIHRDFPRIGHEGRAVEAGRGFAIVSRRLGTPDYWLGLRAISGRSQLLWLEGLSSHAAAESLLATLSTTPGFMQAADSVGRTTADHLEEADVIWAFHRPDLGYRTVWLTPDSRVLQVITFRVRPGLEADFEGVVKTFARAYEDAGVNLPWSVYQVSNGMPGPAYLMMLPMRSLESLDRDLAHMSEVAGKVPDLNALMARWARSGHEVTADLFVLVPGLSHVPAEFARMGGGWWSGER